jgi:hypothetical protein
MGLQMSILREQQAMAFVLAALAAGPGCADDGNKKPAEQPVASKPDQQRAEAALKIDQAEIDKVAQECAASPLGAACAAGQKRIEDMTAENLRLAEDAMKREPAGRKPATSVANAAKRTGKPDAATPG